MSLARLSNDMGQLPTILDSCAITSEGWCLISGQLLSRGLPFSVMCVWAQNLDARSRSTARLYSQDIKPRLVCLIHVVGEIARQDWLNIKVMALVPPGHARIFSYTCGTVRAAAVRSLCRMNQRSPTSRWSVPF